MHIRFEDCLFDVFRLVGGLDNGEYEDYLCSHIGYNGNHHGSERLSEFQPNLLSLG
jgi:hypothetical protein